MYSTGAFHFQIRSVLLLSAFLLAGAGAAAQAPATNDPPLDILSYDLSLDLDLSHDGLAVAENRMKGEAYIAFRNQGAADISEIPLVLNRLLRVSGVRDGDGRTLAVDQTLVEVDGVPMMQVRAARIALAAPLAPGESSGVSIKYDGALVGYRETGMEYVRERLDPAFTIIRPESLSYPMLASAKRTALFARWNPRGDVFDQRMTITAPAGSRPVYGGTTLDERQDETRSRYVFQSTQPGGIFLVPVAPYGEVRRSAHIIYYFPGDAAAAEQLGDALMRATEQLAQWFGPMPNDGLKIAEIPPLHGSQTILPMIIQTVDAFLDENARGELYHELSHVWDAPLAEEQPPRIEEGLAMFMQALIEEKVDGRTDARRRLSERLFKAVRRQVGRAPEAKDTPMCDYGRAGLTDLSYTVGGLFFALLHHRVGDDRFIAAITDFRAAIADSSTCDALVAAVGSLGDEEKRLADEWLTSAQGMRRLMKAETVDALFAAYGG